MNDPLVFAAIDIGSNAVRLLFANVFEEQSQVVFRKNSMIRVPIRLGEDVFLGRAIPEKKADDLVTAMKAFHHLIAVHRPLDIMACATSAVRCASNGVAVMRRIYDETGILVNIIDGRREAELVFANFTPEVLNPRRSYLSIEVGGGSTELTLFSGGERVASRSFRIGAVRLLHNLVSDDDWVDFKQWVRTETRDIESPIGIGSGGNINCMVKLLRTPEGKPVSRDLLERLAHDIGRMSVPERITVLGLRPDRADVITHAADIYLAVMKWTGMKKMLIPKVGVADGLIHVLYENYRNRRPMGSSGA